MPIEHGRAIGKLEEDRDPYQPGYADENHADRFHAPEDMLTASLMQAMMTVIL